MYLRDGPFESDIGIINLHPSKRTHWVLYINETYFDSYGVVSPKKSSRYIIKRNGFLYILNTNFEKMIVIVVVIV